MPQSAHLANSQVTAPAASYEAVQAFSSGAAPVTTQARDVLIGVVGIESGKVPAWATGWTSLPALSVSTDFLDTAYQMAAAAGAYAASGTTSGQWMASIVTLKTSWRWPTERRPTAGHPGQ